MRKPILSEPLELSDLSIYGSSEDSKRIIGPISLTVAQGEWLNLVGVNGSGKTTLARLLAGLTMEGAAGEWSRGFAGDMPSPYVMQQPEAQLFGETPREEVHFALEWLGVSAQEIAPRADRILQETGLLSLTDCTWDQLSGGQRQLAAVAAAAAGEAPLIVFDEATSMLDDRSSRRVQQLARSLHGKGTAVVWVTQRLHELEPSARVIAMLGGGIQYDGRVREFLYGDESRDPAAGTAPCERCGLRLPYLAALGVELKRLDRDESPSPVTVDEWRRVLNLL
ncbi:energy-coupling factor ABC transporter ATP-binding protein [Paenibacillus mendelii]|uniref:Energy-coupling factor ABC transporter ATP-binding protein n=1 Tax=Paenibacillus mendelii TaxID=206163 RepID=A0ABV6J5R2_9BACL|nr:ABC transporter ATP-binding protein [Paenibacillus mendelii]MCQ6560092.1 energy-coupling factor ABC transporter ATP-binding protein [Paenibacillus mendelii]